MKYKRQSIKIEDNQLKKHEIQKTIN
jgi:hypothetical protein